VVIDVKRSVGIAHKNTFTANVILNARKDYIVDTSAWMIVGSNAIHVKRNAKQNVFIHNASRNAVIPAKNV